MQSDQILREQLVNLLRGGQAFTPLEEITEDITVEEAGTSLPQLPYTLWQLLEHMRIALYDILEFSRDANHESPVWPAGYWPSELKPADQAALVKSKASIQDGIEQMIQMVQNPANDLYTPFPYGDGQNLLREALLVAEHQAYHTGQILLLRRLLGTWESTS